MMSQDFKDQVLRETGYRCAVPTCRSILSADSAHLVESEEGKGDSAENLVAICPRCFAQFQEGGIARDSLYGWKLTLASLAKAFDAITVDELLFLATPVAATLRVSGDGVLKFSRLIASGLVTFSVYAQNGALILYHVGFTQKGADLVNAWMRGDRQAITDYFGVAPD